MNLAAVQHFCYDAFCYPLNEDELEINIQTAKDVDRVFLTYGDPFDGGIMGSKWNWHGTQVEITQKKELQAHFRWTIVIKPEFKRARYYFKLFSGNEVIYFAETGFYSEKEFSSVDSFHGYFTFPWMNSADIVKVPEWVKSAVWYQIFPSRFCRGKTDYVPQNLKPWPKFGTPVNGQDIYGGNLRGIIEKLDYLSDLGITGIYTTPINQSTSQHKYDTTDYLTVDKEFGTNEDLKELVQEAHKRGIRIMLDGVFNHSGWLFEPWQDVLKNKEKSKYKDWFMVKDYNITEPCWGKNSNAAAGKFYTFAFVDFMPKLNTNNPELRKYIIDVCRKWVTEYDIDGLRLDVANEISHVFCKELRLALLALKPDFYIIGEIWHNSQTWLRGDEFDAVMNYPLQNAIADFCCKDDWNVQQLEYALNRCYSMYYRQINTVLFNQMDSHDTIRILNRAGGSKTRAKQCLTLLFAMTGSVCIYYGTEVLLPGDYDPDCRRCMPWSELNEGKFNAELTFTKKLIELRKTSPALRSSEMNFLYKEDDKTGTSRIIHIIKTDSQTDEKVGIVLDCSGNVAATTASQKDLLAYAAVQQKDILLSEAGILVYRAQ